MKIPVLGMDPSLTNWGLASADLDLDTGFLSTPELTLISPKKLKNKQVRVNSKDLQIAEEISRIVFTQARSARVIFAEVPVGSQSARAMASYGICVGVIGSLRAMGHTVIEVTAAEVKIALTENDQATKQQMIDAAVDLYPDAKFPIYQGNVAKKSEHLADAIGAIHAGAVTPVFQTLRNILAGN